MEEREVIRDCQSDCTTEPLGSQESVQHGATSSQILQEGGQILVNLPEDVLRRMFGHISRNDLVRVANACYVLGGRARRQYEHQLVLGARRASGEESSRDVSRAQVRRNRWQWETGRHISPSGDVDGGPPWHVPEGDYRRRNERDGEIPQLRSLGTDQEPIPLQWEVQGYESVLQGECARCGFLEQSAERNSDEWSQVASHSD